MSRGAAWLPPTDLPPDDSRAVGWRRACSRSPPERQTGAAIARHEEKNSAIGAIAGGTIGDGLRRRERQPLTLSPYPIASLLEAQALSRWEREDGTADDVKDHAAVCAELGLWRATGVETGPILDIYRDWGPRLLMARRGSRVSWDDRRAWPQTQNGGPRAAAARRCGEDRSDQPPVFSTWLYSRSTGVGRPKMDTATRRRALSSSTLST